MPSLYEIESAARRVQVTLTPRAQSLIQLVLDSVTGDPHRSWRSRFGGRVTSDELTQEERQLTERLPQILREMEKSLRINELSTFDVLHWLTQNLDSICPMKKLPNE